MFGVLISRSLLDHFDHAPARTETGRTVKFYSRGRFGAQTKLLMLMIVCILALKNISIMIAYKCAVVGNGSGAVVTLKIFF